MPERWVTIGKEDRARGLIYIKRLDLINPGSRAAQDSSFQFDRPFLIPYTGTVDNQLVYSKAGQVMEAPKFAPSKWQGIKFEAIWPASLTNGSIKSHDIQD